MAHDRVPDPQIFVSRRLPDQTESRMSELFSGAQLRTDDRALERDELVARLQDVDVFVPTVTDTVDADVISRAGPRLKLIANFGVGVDHIDLKAAHDRGIIVTNTPGVLTEDTADMTMALILSVVRRMREAGRMLRSGDWAGWAPTSLRGRRIGGKALGIVGMGRIGGAVAARANAFGMSVHYHNRSRMAEAAETALRATWWDDLDAMLPEVDILTIHCPLTEETDGLIDARRLGLMKEDAYLVNTARGEIVDEAALAAALKAGKLAGAGLDVFSDEPNVPEALLALPNVTLQPHMGSATVEGRRAMGDKVVTNIRVWSDGHRPPDQVLEGWAP
ncbi:D-glycerate dehydrogenase [Pacificimonas flava]|uniref:D-glycerate dehydrogenase n=2 Tax=Pacificimonas TaxID=1960290 RepID=A0A219B5A0_9SPHN|nr:MULTISPECIES: D-glycerate dehydrogenase [Pacificimonas]MBZ6377323.1 D-glycerate dehydrogenase [Pacificimonas aurantium]OWV32969.1 D-glycerate dehydrogenase [Pacificimonas flava]